MMNKYVGFSGLMPADRDAYLSVTQGQSRPETMKKEEIMKTIALALGALSIAGAAHAASPSAEFVNERPEPATVANSAPATLVKVRADSVMSSKELQRAGLKADQMIEVTLAGDGSGTWEQGKGE